MATSTCKLNYAFADHATKAGIVYTKEELDENMQYSHGGHPNC